MCLPRPTEESECPSGSAFHFDQQPSYDLPLDFYDLSLEQRRKSMYSHFYTISFPQPVLRSFFFFFIV